MRPFQDGVRTDGLDRLPSWPVLAAVLVLHGALFAGLATMRGPRAGAAARPIVTTVRLLEAPRPVDVARPVPRRRTPASHPVRRSTIAPARPAEPAAPPAATAPAISAPAAPSAVRAQDDSLQRYAALVWAQIAAYRRGGLHRPGTVRVTFRLDRQGRLVSLFVARSSGDAMLDAAALATIRAAAPFAPPPPDIGADSLRFTVPFAFS